MVTVPRAELDALKGELRRLRREVGRGVAKRRTQADPGPGGDEPTFTGEEFGAAWGVNGRSRCTDEPGSGPGSDRPRIGQSLFQGVPVRRS